MDGSTYAFTKLNLTNKGITAISEVIADYPHLRYFDLYAELSSWVAIKSPKLCTYKSFGLLSL